MTDPRFSPKARILVVEDSRNQRAHLRSLLEQRGYAVDEAPGGIDALRIIKHDPPDVVLLDLMLDDLDGYSVCRWIRLSERTRDVVVIMLTVRSEVADRVEGLHVGADDYLPKPFADEELEARIFAALRIRETKAELRRRNAELELMLTRTERLAMTDDVTGIFNRRRFLDLLRREWTTAQRYKHPIAVAIGDLDRFKQVNDQEGHAAGDDALRKVANLLTACMREVDVCARYAGDEFVLMLPHTTREGAVTALERIRARLHREREHWSPGMAHLDLSFGVSSNEDPSLTSPDELVEAADRALYDAKRTGGAAVVIARDGVLGT